MFRFQRWEFVQAVRSLFDAGGQTIDPQVLSDIQLVQAISAPIDESPYSKIFTPCGTTLAKAIVAGEFSFVGVRPDSKKILQVMGIWLSHDDAATRLMSLTLMTGAQVATVGVDATTPLSDFSGQQVGLKVASNSWAGSLNTVTGTGTGVAQIYVPTGVTVYVEFPKPGIILRGDDGTAPPSLSARHVATDLAVRTSWACREWPLA